MRFLTESSEASALGSEVVVMDCDVVVVGGGHAGTEAACAAAGMGCEVVVVTLDRGMIGEMPCNPAVGGIGKGHLTAEVDALGGIQGWAADQAGIQFKVLNGSRGPAVWGPRAQVDKRRYREVVQEALQGLGRVAVVEGEVEGVLLGDGAVEGVRLVGGERIRAQAVVVTAGTFLRGVLHSGCESWSGGRLGERPSIGLGAELEALGVRLARFKTGTPPRLDRDSIDLDELMVQRGDDEPRPFSWRTAAVANRAVCWVTRTPRKVQQIIRDNLESSPLFSGRIVGVGPRYCPSIEDKVVRFPHHEEHTVFLEPEGLATNSLYVNGLSTSLAPEVQEQVVRAVSGMERARFLRYGYAVEYDTVASGQVERSLCVGGVSGLFVGGQLLGSSGYEEAAALGLVAGVNAVRWLRGEAPFVVGREEGYIGVLVDDLVVEDHQEPYRMMTARAEHRLVLGVDSARERLMARGVKLGLVPEAVFHMEQARWERRRRAMEWAENTALNPNRDNRELVARVAGVELKGPTTWAGLLRRHDVAAGGVAEVVPVLAAMDAEDRRIVVERLRYSGYLARAERERERVVRLRAVEIPADLDLASIPGLSREVRERLERARPLTLGDAERLGGVTAAAVAILAGRVERQRR